MYYKPYVNLIIPRKWVISCVGKPFMFLQCMFTRVDRNRDEYLKPELSGLFGSKHKDQSKQCNVMRVTQVL